MSIETTVELNEEIVTRTMPKTNKNYEITKFMSYETLLKSLVGYIISIEVTD